MIDVQVDITTKDLAVVCEIVLELEDNARKTAAQLERQRRDIADLKATLAEWRERCI
jgi:hypothetical protein